MIIVSLCNRIAEGKRWQNVCVTNVSCEFCRDPLLPLLCSGRKQSVLSKVTFGETFFQTYVYHTMFAAVFPSQAFCISSLLSTDQFTVVGLVP